MSEIDQFILLAQYNKLMNERQFSAAARLSAQELREDKGAFFKSVLGTLNHILVGDILWLKRFARHPSSREVLSYVTELETPGSLNTMLFAELDDLYEERTRIDAIIIRWVSALSENNLDDCITYSSMAGNSYSKPFSSLVHHLFLHQVHHRGQVTTLLSQYGVDFGETDLVELIRECEP